MPNIQRDSAREHSPTPIRPSALLATEQLAALAMDLRKNAKPIEAAEVFTQIADRLPDDWVAQYNAGAALLESAQLAESETYLNRAVTRHAFVDGYNLYAHVLALRGDIRAARSAYENARALTPDDFTANWGLFEVTQLLDDNAAALRHQRIALRRRSLVSIEALEPPARTTILELCVAGTFQANIPLDFILDPRRTTVHKLYLGEHPIPALPPYDLVFNTIADAPNVAGALDLAEKVIAAGDRPALNTPKFVQLTSRDSVAAQFAGSQLVAVARTIRTTRDGAPGERTAFPFLIRPLDSHAGNDLAKIDDAQGLDRYLAATPDADEFYISAFIDYRNADGFYRKYRIVFVDGVPYPVHQAISPNWMIHYYNAPMDRNAWMREEEHAFMRDMDAVFRGRLAAGLREIARLIPLDYFGIDCSIAADGRVLLFEASTAMIVHMRDPVDLYPYKAQYVPRVIRALERLFDDRLGRPHTANARS